MDYGCRRCNLFDGAQGSGAKAGDDMGLPGQGGAVMNFPFRDFPWYFEDYNLDGQQDFFLGTCIGGSENYQSYHYLMTVTAEAILITAPFFYTR